MATVMSEATQGVYIRPSRSIGGITMDVTVEETHVDELVLTEHPVEQGASISDHAYCQPKKVTIRAGASDSGGDTPAEGRCVEIYLQLLELQGTREPFELVTGKRSYPSMQITSITETTDKDSGSVILVTAELQEVIMATVQVVAIPRSRQRNGHKTGGVDQRGQVQAEKREDVPESALFAGLGG
ncbi:MAG: phage baseplate protein [Desulfovibrionaceae bacterium]